MTNDSHTDLMRRRYGGTIPEAPTLSNPVVDLMLRHRSVRRYRDTPLPEGMLETLIAAGQSGATSSNVQAASVVAATDPELRQYLADLPGSQAFLAGAPVVLCFVLDLARSRRIAARRAEDLACIEMIDTYTAAVTDVTIMAQNVTLAAESFGLGTCYVGNLRNAPEMLAEKLGLPEGAVVLFGLTIGYEDGPETAIRPRLPQSVVLARNHYASAADDAAAIAAYDAIYAEYERGQNRPPNPWSARLKDRFGSAAVMAGRDKMKAVLKRMGFSMEY